MISAVAAFEDSQRLLWFGDKFGHVVSFERASARFTTYDLATLLSRYNAPPLTTPAGANGQSVTPPLWVSPKGPLYEHFHKFPAPLRIRAIYQMSRGPMMFGTESGLAIFDRERAKWEFFGQDQQRASRARRSRSSNSR